MKQLTTIKRLKKMQTPKMNTLILFFSFLSLSISSFAQPTFDWANIIGNDDYLSIKSYEVDSKGNSYYVGDFSGSIDADPGTPSTILTVDPTVNSSNTLQIILKLNADGSFAWVKSFPSTNNAYISTTKLKIDKLDNPTLIGWFTGTIDFDLDPIKTSLLTTPQPVGNEVQTSFISKWDSNGNFIWVTPISTNGVSYACSDLAFDSKNDIFITANSIGTIASTYQPGTPTINFGGSNPIDVLGVFVAKFNSNGIFSWVKSDSLNASVASIAIDGDDNILLTGSLGGGTLTPVDFNLNPTETFIFTPIGAGGSGGINGIDAIYGGYYDLFCLKMDNNANFLWARGAGVPNWMFIGKSIITDVIGNSYIVGTCFKGNEAPNPCDIDTSAAVINVINGWPGTLSDFILKIDALGNFVWANSLQSGIGYSLINSISIDKCSNIYVAGQIGGSDFYLPTGKLDINPDPVEQSLVDQANGGYLAKYDSDLKFIWVNQFDNTEDTRGSSSLNVVHVDDAYSIHIAGATGITLMDVNPDATITTPLPSVGLYNVFFLKLNQTPPPPLSLSASVNPICPGQESVITATGADTYTWTPTTGESSNAGATYTVKPSITTKYTVQGISNNCVLTDTITISTTVATLTHAGNDTTICEGDTVTLTAKDYTTAHWSTGATTAEISVTPTETTPYIFTTVSNNCTITDTVVVTVNPLPIIGLSSFISIPQGNSTILTAAGGGTYLWTPADGLSCTDCATPTATPEVETNYCVTVTDENNCVSKACEKVKFDLVCGNLFIPTGFSPNGDNINDKLEVKINSECVTDYSFMIFDRWGEKVFETTKVADSWDGKYNGKELDNAVFVYYAKLKLVDANEPIVKKGNVSLIK